MAMQNTNEESFSRDGRPVLLMSPSNANEVVPEVFNENVQEDTSSSRDSEIRELARSFTNLSQHSVGSSHGTDLGPIPSNVNPFDPDNSDPRLDPYSDKFSGKAWAHHMLRHYEKDPEMYPTRTAGVSFKNMGAYGYGKGTDYQKNVLNIVTSIFSKVGNVGNKGTKIQILRNFNGLVRNGECCVVLGRPGR